MKNKRIQIVFACNDKIWKGLYLSILSIVSRTKRNIDFFVLTADLTEVSPNYVSLSKKHSNLVEKMIKDFNPKSTLTIINCKKAYMDAKKGTKIKKNFHTPYTCFRLLLNRINVIKGKVLYLDVDTMTNGDIAQAYDVNMKNNEMCVAHDRLIGEFNKNKYFNAGVILFNLNECKKTNMLQKAFTFLLERNPIYSDQSSLNRTWTRIMFWEKSDRFNYQGARIKKDTIIKHFCISPRIVPWYFNIKQWDIKKVQKILKLHNWDEDYKYYLSHINNSK